MFRISSLLTGRDQGLHVVVRPPVAPEAAKVTADRIRATDAKCGRKANINCLI